MTSHFREGGQLFLRRSGVQKPLQKRIQRFLPALFRSSRGRNRHLFPGSFVISRSSRRSLLLHRFNLLKAVALHRIRIFLFVYFRKKILKISCKDLSVPVQCLIDHKLLSGILLLRKCNDLIPVSFKMTVPFHWLWYPVHAAHPL